MPKIENEAQLWTNLHLMCKVFSINENLFHKTEIILATGENLNGFKVSNVENTKIVNGNSRSNSIDSNSMNSIKQSINENLNVNSDHNDDASLNNGVFNVENLNSNKSIFNVVYYVVW